MPRKLIGEIGFKIKHDIPPKTIVKNFFERYMQTDQPDHAYEHKVEFGEYVATLITPAFYGRQYVGNPSSTQDFADESACQTFLADPDVKEVIKKVAPSSKKVKRYVTSVIDKQKGWRWNMRQRGIDPNLVVEEVVQIMFQSFRDDIRCRLAIWDGNAWNMSQVSPWMSTNVVS